MKQKTQKLYASAQIENIDLGHRLERKLNDRKSFNKSLVNIKDKITYFEDKDIETKRKNNKEC